MSPEQYKPLPYTFYERHLVPIFLAGAVKALAGVSLVVILRWIDYLLPRTQYSPEKRIDYLQYLYNLYSIYIKGQECTLSIGLGQSRLPIVLQIEL